MADVQHTGGCHCGAVRFKLSAPAEVVVNDCNCSVCYKKQNRHFIIPQTKFTLLQGEDYLTTYRFNTGVAKHMFCKVCGVQSFYQPRCTPDGYGIAPHCVDPGTITDIKIEAFDGQNWEATIERERKEKANRQNDPNESS